LTARSPSIFHTEMLKKLHLPQRPIWRAYGTTHYSYFNPHKRSFLYE
jgi:hypothetical protein